MQPLMNTGVLGAGQPASILEAFRQELSKAFGTEAQIKQEGGATYVVIPLTREMIKEIISSRMSPQYASATDVRIENNTVQVLLRVL